MRRRGTKEGWLWAGVIIHEDFRMNHVLVGLTSIRLRDASFHFVAVMGGETAAGGKETVVLMEKMSEDTTKYSRTSGGAIRSSAATVKARRCSPRDSPSIRR